MNDFLLNFFIGGFENIFNPLYIEVKNLNKSIESQGKQIMATLAQVQELTTKIAELTAATEAEKVQVAEALGTLQASVDALTAQIAELQDPAIEAALSEAIASVSTAVAGVQAIYEPAV